MSDEPPPLRLKPRLRPPEGDPSAAPAPAPGAPPAAAPPGDPNRIRLKPRVGGEPAGTPSEPSSAAPAPARVVPYTRGLHEVADKVWAWTLPDGGYGWSNAGLVAGDGASLLVDTLFDWTERPH